jgi:hypothetical protein
MALPTYVADGGRAQSAAADLTPTMPSHQAGDILLCIVEHANETCTLATANGFVEVADSPQGTGVAAGASSAGLSVFWKRAASGADTAPVIEGTALNHLCASISSYRGCITTGNPWDVTAGNVETTATTAVSVPGDTTTVADCLIVAIASSRFDNSTGQVDTSTWANADLANVTGRFTHGTNQANGGGFGVGTGEKAAAGTFGASTATLNNAAQQGRLMIALKPPAVTVVTTDVGAVVAAGLAPTVTATANALVTPALGTVTAAGLAPTASTPTTVTAGLGAATAAGLAPTVAVTNNQSVTTDVGAVVAVGLEPTVSTTAGTAPSPALGEVTAAGLAPTVTATTNALVRPDLGAVTAAGSAPTVTATNHQTVAPALGTVDAAGLAPTVSATANTQASTALGAVVAAGLEPTVSATAHVTVTPDLGAVVAAGLAPTAEGGSGVTRTPLAGEATAEGLAPTVTAFQHVTVTPALGAAVIAGLAPTVLTPVTVVSATGELDATGFEPIASVTTHVLVRPAVGAVEAAGYAPEIDTGALVVEPGTGTVTARGLRPTVTGSPATAAIRRIVSPSEILDIILRDGHRKPRWW